MTGGGARLVVGVEVHVQLATRTKAFCACPAEFGAEPNTNVCPVCLGHPGALPVINRAALETAIRAGLSLGCRVAPKGHTQWDRKNYFYPDLPKGYQITQYEFPLCEDGAVVLTDGTRVRVRRAHLEEDTGKSSHASDGETLVDFNRAGVPLLEIVTDPIDPATPERVEEYLRRLQDRVRLAGASECSMEKGQMRCEPNVSLARSDGSSTAISEIKNINSFAAVREAVAAEAKRLEDGPWHAAGRALPRATYGWDHGAGRTILQRTKESAADYRYFPEPDLPVLPAEALEPFVERGRAALAEAEAAVSSAREATEASSADLGLTAQQARLLLVQDISKGRFHSAVEASEGKGIPRAAAGRELAKWFLGPISGWINARGGDWASLMQRGPRLADLLASQLSGALTPTTVRQQFLAGEWLGTETTVEEFVKANSIPFISKDTTYEPLVASYGKPDEVSITSVRESTRAACEEVFRANPDLVAKIRSGKTTAKQALVGQVMRKTRGTADPARVNALLDDLLRG